MQKEKGSQDRARTRAEAHLWRSAEGTVGIAGAADRLGPAAPAIDYQHYGGDAAQK